MKTKHALSILFIIIASTCVAQYRTAVGVRGIGTTGVTVKHFYRGDRAYEGIVGFDPGVVSATLVFAQYTPAFDVPGLRWYYGIGGHLTSYAETIRVDGQFIRDEEYVGIGVDGIFGLEYLVDTTPIAISLDLKPNVEFIDNGRSRLALDPGLGIKITF